MFVTFLSQSLLLILQPPRCEFSDISLNYESKKKIKVPRRLIHCSDGVLEEYSTDEEEETPEPPPVNSVCDKLHKLLHFYTH